MSGEETRLRQSFVADIHVPSILKRVELGSDKERRTFLLIGASGSGVLGHAHAAAWNALVRGTKLWVLFRPGEHEPAHEWENVNDWVCELPRAF